MDTVLGFTIGSFGSVRDRQSASLSRDVAAIAAALAAPREAQAMSRVGEYVIDYSPLAPGALIDADVDAELEAMLAASVVVHRNEGV